MQSAILFPKGLLPRGGVSLNRSLNEGGLYITQSERGIDCSPLEYNSVNTSICLYYAGQRDKGEAGTQSCLLYSAHTWGPQSWLLTAHQFQSEGCWRYETPLDTVGGSSLLLCHHVSCLPAYSEYQVQTRSRCYHWFMTPTSAICIGGFYNNYNKICRRYLAS